MNEKKDNLPIIEDMSEEDFNNMMKESLERADKGEGRPSKAVFDDIRKKIRQISWICFQLLTRLETSSLAFLSSISLLKYL